MNTRLSILLIAVCLSCSKTPSNTLHLGVVNQYWIPENVYWHDDYVVFETAYVFDDSLLYLISSFQRKIKSDSIEVGIEPGFGVRKVRLPIVKQEGQTTFEPTLLLGNYTEKDGKHLVQITFRKRAIQSLVSDGVRYVPTPLYSVISKNLFKSYVFEAEEFPHKKSKIIEVED